MNSSGSDRRYHDFISALFAVLLAALFAYLIAWVGYLVVVVHFGQEPLMFYVALAIAVLIWFIEEMLHLTVPCRRFFRRLAYSLADRWCKCRGSGHGEETVSHVTSNYNN